MQQSAHSTSWRAVDPPPHLGSKYVDNATNFLSSVLPPKAISRVVWLALKALKMHPTNFYRATMKSYRSKNGWNLRRKNRAF